MNPQYEASVVEPSPGNRHPSPLPLVLRPYAINVSVLTRRKICRATARPRSDNCSVSVVVPLSAVLSKNPGITTKRRMVVQYSHRLG